MSRPVRILHVLGSLDRGGAETWLMHVLRGIDRDRFRLDFLVHRDDPGEYADEARALGSRIIRCPNPHAPLTYAARFRAALAEHGPFDVVHSHVHYYSGWVLSAARRAGVPVRIAHSHCGAVSVAARPGAWHSAYRRVMRRMIRTSATHGLAASAEAAAALWGAGWRSDPRWRVLHCGVDLRPFAERADRGAVRRDLGIPAGCRVVGHVGSFTPAKNHRFLLDVAAEAVRGADAVRILLVGDGPLRRDMEERAAALGVAGSVVFAGVRPDVPRIMTGAMDVFLFPSLFEGLPLAVVEAQAAGLPVVIADTVSREVAVLPELLSWVSLSAPAATWAARCREALAAPGGDARTRALDVARSGRFSIDANIESLRKIYADGIAGSAGLPGRFAAGWPR